MNIVLTALDWLQMLGHFLSLSLLAVGGAIATAPDMHRYLVEQQHWLSQSQFSACMALAQAAPGPNLLFIPLMGWTVGINSAGGVASGMAAWPWGFLGVLISLVGMLLPSTTLALAAARWGHRNRERLGVRAFKAGMAPIVIGLLGATGWILAHAQDRAAGNEPLWLLTVLVTLLVWRTRIHLLWLLAAGGLLGWFGLV
ncbi:MAG: chromate transporter [Rhodoferax sp.]|nr:chromate transporter [Rhodoferax sp.]